MSRFCSAGRSPGLLLRDPKQKREDLTFLLGASTQ